jgi:putative ABC transport system permease protein
MKELVSTDEVWQDVRFATRTLRSRKGFAGAAILTLALSIGATTAVFSVIDGVLLEPFPIEDQDHVLVVWSTLTDRGFEYMPFTFAAYEEMRERVVSAELAAHPYHGASRAILDKDGVSTPLQVAGVTGGWFGVLGVRPAFGRMLDSADDHLGAAPVAVLSPGIADRWFGGSRDAVGQTIRLNNTTYTIVGIAPQGFEYPHGTEIWTPATALFLSDLENASSLHDAYQVGWHMMVRVAPGFTIEQTRAELQSTLGTLASGGEWLGEQRIRARTFAEIMVGDVRPPLLLLGGAVLLVMLIAGVNVANLLLVRGLTRRRELAVRTAIGASRGRIMRQLATEAIVLVAVGAAASLLVAHFALSVLLVLAPAELPRLSTIGIDARALVFTALLALLVATAFGILPAVLSTRLEQGTVLRSRDGSVEPGTRGYWLRHGLLVAQIAIAVLVLSTAGLLLRSLDRLQRLDLGFAAEGIALVEVVMPPERFPNESDHQAATMNLAERTARYAGVSGATALTTAPFAGNGGVDAIWYGEGQTGDPANNPYANYEGADTSHFDAMRLPVLRGRDFDASDRANSLPVVVVNEAFARLYWPGADPVGKRLKMGTPDSESEWRTVVGLVADSRYRELTNARPSVYVPYAQGIPIRPRYIAVRSAANAADALSLVKRAVAELQPDASVIGAVPLPRLLAEPLARPRFQSALITSFALLGLTLSVIGTYGVLAFFVRQRTREIGIRMALGADAGNVRGFVMRQGLAIGAFGVLIGLAGAITTGRFLQSLLFDVSATDPLVLFLATACLLAATVSATWIPMRAATRTSPMLVMGSD